MSTDDLTITDALRQADAIELVDKPGHLDPVTASGRIILGPSLWPTTHEPKRLRPFRWEWKVSDHASGQMLDNGWSFTEGWARHRADAAARRIYAERWDKRKAAQAEAER